LESSSWRSTLGSSGVAHCPILEHSRLSNGEALYLYQRWNDHRDTLAKNHLIRAGRRHVTAIALTYCRYGLPLVELIAAGETGLLRALETFDAQRDRRFSTYVAYRIRLCILDQVSSSICRAGSDSTHWSPKVIRGLRRERTRITMLIDGLHAMERAHAEGTPCRGGASPCANACEGFAAHR
jgi:RNA polymerase sigma-32 factor